MDCPDCIRQETWKSVTLILHIPRLALLWLNIPSRCLYVHNVKVKVDHIPINEGLGGKKGMAAQVKIQP